MTTRAQACIDALAELVALDDAYFLTVANDPLTNDERMRIRHAVQAARAALALPDDPIGLDDGPRDGHAVSGPDVDEGRCKVVGPRSTHGMRCGLPEGHDGDHTLLIPSGAPWFPRAQEPKP